jgi:hypothetical protein
MIFVPSFNGNQIFGYAVSMVHTPDTAACQMDAFFGLPGFVAVYGNTRGRTFQVRGVLLDDSPTDVIINTYIFLPTSPNNIVGTVGTLTDTMGNNWNNVIYLGQFQQEPGYPKPAAWGDADGNQYVGWAIPYQCVFRGLA